MNKLAAVYLLDTRDAETQPQPIAPEKPDAAHFSCRHAASEARMAADETGNPHGMQRPPPCGHKSEAFHRFTPQLLDETYRFSVHRFRETTN
jgi:hypothetical protein